MGESVFFSMSLGRDQLKLDITSLDIEGEGQRFVLVNANIPFYGVVLDPARYEEVLQSTANFLDRFLGVNHDISFEVTSAYLLRHRVTNDERPWTGSFRPSQNLAAALTGPQFLPYNRPAFLRAARAFGTEEAVIAALRWEGRSTEWEFDSLVSLIFNFQFKVGAAHRILVHHGLQTANRRRVRRHVCLPYPF